MVIIHPNDGINHLTHYYSSSRGGGNGSGSSSSSSSAHLRNYVYQYITSQHDWVSGTR